jgi:predicted HicB family RNase H-like nuclease
MKLSTKHLKTLEKLYEKPTCADIKWTAIVALLKACGGTISQREGSRMCVKLGHQRAVSCAPPTKGNGERRRGRCAGISKTGWNYAMTKTNLLSYKGYIGEVDFDSEAKVFYGRVINTRDPITFQSDNAKRLEDEFRFSIDTYLSFCAELGETPEKPYSGRFVLRLSPEECYRRREDA